MQANKVGVEEVMTGRGRREKEAAAPSSKSETATETQTWYKKIEKVEIETEKGGKKIKKMALFVFRLLPSLSA